MGTSRSKVRLAAPVAILSRLIEGAAGVDAFFTDPETRNVALHAIKQALAGGRFVPCVGTSYRRRCLAAGPELRVTLDEDLTFFHPVSLGRPRDNGEVVALGPARVLEVKYAGPLPDWLECALEALDEVPGLSKFQLGMLAVQRAAPIQAVPASRFPRSPFTDSPGAAPRNTLRPYAGA
jgi:VTC domain